MATAKLVKSKTVKKNLRDSLMTRSAWKELGYSVPIKEEPTKIEEYRVPGYRRVYRDRHLFSFLQVNKVSATIRLKRQAAAVKAIETRIRNMEDAMENVELTIVSGLTDEEIRDLAISTHGGNYQGKVGEFIWSNRTARNTIRHALTNYEAQWARINRGTTGEEAYEILRERVDDLVNKTYPQFAEGEPEPWAR